MLQYVLPLLHISLGIVNRLLKSLLDYVPETIENVTPEETQAREAYFTSILELESANKELEQWLGNFAQELATFQ